MTKYAIWDIDNCLADDKWRAHLIDWNKTGNERYSPYNEKMPGDSAHHLAEFEFMNRFTTPVFFTGRVKLWEAATRTWLVNRGFVDTCCGYRLYMRDNDDNSTPVALKERMLKSFLAELGPSKAYDIVAAFDDIPAVVAMYQHHNIPACVLRINEDLSNIYLPHELISNHA